MQEWLSRTELIIKTEGIKKLSESHVLVMGLGGVGAYAAELVARAGIGEMTIIDGDTITPTNINRQLPATTSTLKKHKTDVMEIRITDINPEIKLHSVSRYIEYSEMEKLIHCGNYDFVIDAIDTLAPKINLITACKENNTDVISSMGAGGRIDPSAVKYADISKTEHCALARAVRRGLRDKGIKSGIMTVFSEEDVSSEYIIPTEEKNKRTTVGTISYLPAIFGCYLASYTIRKLIGLW
ncbi:MAG: tRNA threonylcarbamoyladenosine dehydratase [Bacteroidales bacterium]